MCVDAWLHFFHINYAQYWNIVLLIRNDSLFRWFDGCGIRFWCPVHQIAQCRTTRQSNGNIFRRQTIAMIELRILQYSGEK